MMCFDANEDIGINRTAEEDNKRIYIDLTTLIFC